MLFRTVKPGPDAPYGAACWLCRRTDDGLGFQGPGRGEVTWSCKDHADGQLFRKARNMSRQEFAGVETTAILKAGEDAGAYMDKIGKTDLATFTAEEWKELLRIVVVRFGDHVTEILKDCPF